MKHSALSLSAVCLLFWSLPVFAQEPDFNLTYHVERSPMAQLSIDTCASVVTAAAEQAGLASAVQRFPGQLAVIRGGVEGRGAFIVQCIAVDETTVSVVQGIDYRGQKGALGEFADQAFSAVKAAAK